ncbi:uroporphyrinogen decarboxylase family protein [Candidatus Latescibacterota bacterium]
MNIIERFENVMSSKSTDCIPLFEWAGWWDKTLERWYKEGLPEELRDDGEIREYFGLDCHRQKWISPLAETCPKPECEGTGLVTNKDEYQKLKAHLYPEPAFDKGSIEAWAEKQKKNEMIVWISLDGFFWYPRTILGIQRHLLAFYDSPELMHMINNDLLSFNLRAIEEFCKICSPNFMTFGEDMSYNKGPMISKKFFDQYMAPYYRKIIPVLKDFGIIPFIDTDGDVIELIPWFEEVGIEGILPLERMAGVDVDKISRNHPNFKMIGAFDKTVMNRGEKAMRREFERLLPVMKRGGFIPSVDHQTPPGVSLEQYRNYIALLNEYCKKAAE